MSCLAAVFNSLCEIFFVMYAYLWNFVVIHYEFHFSAGNKQDSVIDICFHL